MGEPMPETGVDVGASALIGMDVMIDLAAPESN